jgi:hypothetical protein
MQHKYNSHYEVMCCKEFVATTWTKTAFQPKLKPKQIVGNFYYRAITAHYCQTRAVRAQLGSCPLWVNLMTTDNSMITLTIHFSFKYMYKKSVQVMLTVHKLWFENNQPNPFLNLTSYTTQVSKPINPAKQVIVLPHITTHMPLQFGVWVGTTRGNVTHR